MLEVCRNIFAEWNSKGLKYCHWKSNEHLVAGLNGLTDLDVLLSKENKEEGCTILVKMNCLKCKSQYGSRYPDVEDWVGMDDETGNLIHIHLHFNLLTGHKGMKEYSLPWTADMLETRMLDEKSNVYISDPNWELITLYTRICLKASDKQVRQAQLNTFCLSNDYQKEISYLKQRVNWAVINQNLLHYFSIEAEGMLSLMKKEKMDSHSFLVMRKMTERMMESYNRYGKFSTFLRKNYFHAVLRLMSYLKRKNYNLILRKTPSDTKGITVAFIGQDGAGKSTITTDLEKWLRWKMEGKRIYLGSGESYMSLEKLILNKLRGKKSFLIRDVTLFLQLIKYLRLSKNVLKTILRARQYANKGGIALFDRFPQTMVYGINDGPKIRELYAKRVHNSVLKSIILLCAQIEEKNLKKAAKLSPSIVVKLFLPPEESIRRKPRENNEVVKRKHQIIKALMFDGSKTYTIDATQEYSKELLEIKRIIWTYLIS